jgi:hypothetical protein
MNDITKKEQDTLYNLEIIYLSKSKSKKDRNANRISIG